MKQLKPNTEIEPLVDSSGKTVKKYYYNTRSGELRKRWWTKARVPGTVRSTRMPGGSGYRGDKLWEGG